MEKSSSPGRLRRLAVVGIGPWLLACSGGEPPQAPASSPSQDAPTAESVPTPTSTSDVQRLDGMMVYLADAPRFSDCRTGLSRVMAQEGDYLAAERAYLEAGAQGEPLFMTLEGRFERRPGMEGGEVDALVVTRFHGAVPGQGCEAEPVVAGLERTEWRLVELPGGVDMPPGVGATLILDPEGRRSSGSTGCNAFSGGYDLQGGRLSVSVTALTRRACAAPATDVERDFLEALRVAGAYRFAGAFLELLGEQGPVARFAPPER